jgi:hypothetical protein
MVNFANTTESVLGRKSGELILRVCGSSRHGQIVRLKSNKCTIGSESNCTLRLRCRGVEPVHCLILRGSAGTVVRRWSRDTRLNGQTFSDAPLRGGDRLSIGPIDLEIIDPGVSPRAETSKPAARPAEPVFDGILTDKLQERFDDLQNGLENTLGERLSEQADSSRQEITQQLQSLAERITGLQEQFSSPAQDKIASTVYIPEELAEQIKVQSAHIDLLLEKIALLEQYSDKPATTVHIPEELAQQIKAQSAQIDRIQEEIARLQPSFSAESPQLAEDVKQHLQQQTGRLAQLQEEVAEELQIQCAQFSRLQEELTRQYQAIADKPDRLSGEVAEQLRSQSTQISTILEKIALLEQCSDKPATTVHIPEEISEQMKAQSALLAQLQDGLVQLRPSFSGTALQLPEEMRQQLQSLFEQTTRLHDELAALDEKQIDFQTHLADEMASQRESQSAGLNELREELSRNQQSLWADIAKTPILAAERLQTLAASITTLQEALAENRQEQNAQSARVAETLAGQIQTLADQFSRVRDELDDSRRAFSSNDLHFSEEISSKLQTQSANFDARLREIDAKLADFAQRMQSLSELTAERNAQSLPSAAPPQDMLPQNAIPQFARREVRHEPNAEDMPQASAEPEQTEMEPLEIEPERKEARRSSPVDLAAVLRKFGAEDLLSEETTAEASSCEPTSEAAVAEKPVQTASPTTPGPLDEEDSIDDYMSRLLERVRGTSGSAYRPEPPSESKRPEQSEAAPSPLLASQESTPIRPVVAPSSKPVRMTPITSAPEKQLDLSAMRELANLSAQKALDRHSRKVLIESGRTKLLVAAVGLTAAGALSVFRFGFDAPAFAVHAALFGSVVAVYWGLQYAVLAGKLEIQRSGKYGFRLLLKQTAKPAAVHAPEAKQSGDPDS